jgi:hypothetical protein
MVTGDERDDPPQRWERDSPAEDFEASRARQLDELDAWARDQRYRPLTDAMESDGIIRERCETLAVAWVVPPWWASVSPPEPRCSWCQAPGAGDPCGPCLAAREHASDPPGLLAWWESLDPQARRMYVAVKHRTDPWSGRPVIIMCEWAETGSDGASVASGVHPLAGFVPACRWDAEGRSG